MNGWKKEEEVETWLAEKIEDLLVEVCDQLDTRDIEKSRQLLLDAVNNT